MSEIFIIKGNLDELAKQYSTVSQECSTAGEAFLKAKDVYDTLFAKRSIERKILHPEESATDRKQEILVLLEKEKIELTALEATHVAAKGRLKSIETNKQMLREQCELVRGELYALGRGDVVSEKKRFK